MKGIKILGGLILWATSVLAARPLSLDEITERIFVTARPKLLDEIREAGKRIASKENQLASFSEKADTRLNYSEAGRENYLYYNFSTEGCAKVLPEGESEVSLLTLISDGTSSDKNPSRGWKRVEFIGTVASGLFLLEASDGTVVGRDIPIGEGGSFRRAHQSEKALSLVSGIFDGNRLEIAVYASYFAHDIPDANPCELEGYFLHRGDQDISRSLSNREIGSTSNPSLAIRGCTASTPSILILILAAMFLLKFRPQRIKRQRIEMLLLVLLTTPVFSGERVDHDHDHDRIKPPTEEEIRQRERNIAVVKKAAYERKISHQYMDTPSCVPSAMDPYPKSDTHFRFDWFLCNGIYSSTDNGVFSITLQDYFPFKYRIYRNYLFSSRTTSAVQAVPGHLLSLDAERASADSGVSLVKDRWQRADDKIFFSEDEYYYASLSYVDFSQREVEGLSKAAEGDRLSPTNLKLNVDFRDLPLTQEVDVAPYLRYHGVQTNQNISIYADKASVLSYCQSLADSRDAERRIGDVAQSALEKLTTILRESDRSLSSVLEVYFDETETVLEETLASLKEKVAVLGIDGRYLIEQLEGISLIKGTECIASWDIRRIHENADGFLAEVVTCHEAGSLTETNFALLKSLVGFLTDDGGRGSREIQRILGDLGDLPEVKSKADLQYETFSALGNSVLIFLKKHNSEAYRACKEFVTWGQMAGL